MDNQKISMPTEAEKQRAIARILDAGLPRRVAFGRELREVLQRIGPRALLFGVGDCLALSLLIDLYSRFIIGNTYLMTFTQKFDVVLGNPPWGSELITILQLFKESVCLLS